MHFVLGALPDADGEATVTGNVVVIGLGNGYRRDDGVGPVIAAAVDERALPGVRVVNQIADSLSLLEAWSGAALAVLVDAAISSRSAPGRVRLCALSEVTGPRVLSSHGLDVSGALALGRALDRLPAQLVILTVDAEDTSHGVGLTPKVAAAVPQAIVAIEAEIARTRTLSVEGLSQ